MGTISTIKISLTLSKCRVFHDPFVSLNFEGFDPQIFLYDPQNLLLTFFNSYGGGHCDPLNRKLRENPASVLLKLNYKNIFTVLKFTEHYLEKLNENCKMEQLQINLCFETLLLSSNPIRSNFQFSIDSSSGLAFFSAFSTLIFRT